VTDPVSQSQPSGARAAEPSGTVPYGALSLTMAAIGTLWLLLIWHLAGHWGAIPQYSFGWMVPVLGTYLAMQRWCSRPSAAPVKNPMALLPVALLALAFLPLWLVEKPNPEWRLVSWLFAAVVAALTLAILRIAGGRRWVTHFAFPACFVFAAVPWPTAIELPVTQALMRGVAAISVEVMGLLGTPALQHGNVIRVGPGLVGIDEACSGVHSLQATLMAALFFGEMYGLPPARRLAVLVGGVFIAFASNVCRTFFLAWNASRNGLTSIDQWHDPAGLLLLTMCFVAVWALANAARTGQLEPPLPRRESSSAWLPFPAAAGLTSWIVLVCVGTELWFRSAPKERFVRWHVVPPVQAQRVPIEPKVASMMRADSSVASAWKGESGTSWLMYFFEWQAGPSRGRILARMHRPEVCLPAAGICFVEDRGIVTVAAGTLAVPFRASAFEQNGRPIFVYYCVWENGGANETSSQSSQLQSLLAVARRERNLGQQIAEFALFGCATGEQADQLFRRELSCVIRLPKGSPAGG